MSHIYLVTVTTDYPRENIPDDELKKLMLWSDSLSESVIIKNKKQKHQPIRAGFFTQDPT